MTYHPWESHAPAAMLALVTALRNVTATMTTGAPKVHYGPYMSAASDQNVLVIGWTGFVPGYQYPSRVMSEELYSAIINGNSSQEGLAPSSRETFEIACGSLVRSGSNDENDAVQTVNTAYANLKIVGTVLQKTSPPPWLSGAVARAEMAPAVSAHLAQDRRGLLCVVTFNIRCESFAQS
jgi:hypothetical protein